MIIIKFYAYPFYEFLIVVLHIICLKYHRIRVKFKKCIDYTHICFKKQIIWFRYFMIYAKFTKCIPSKNELFVIVIKYLFNLYFGPFRFDKRYYSVIIAYNCSKGHAQYWKYLHMFKLNVNIFIRFWWDSVY